MVHRSVLIALRDTKETSVEGKSITLFSRNNCISFTIDIFSEKWNKLMLSSYHLNGKAGVFLKSKSIRIIFLVKRQTDAKKLNLLLIL